MTLPGGTEVLTIRMPASELRRLRRVAEISRRPIDEVIADTLRANLPPLLEDVPPAMRSELAALEKLSSQDLYREINAKLTPEQLAEYDALLDTNAAETLDDATKHRLVELRMEADRLMFRKAYAALLLKWRGQRIPTLNELPLSE